jgi:hypothetical protein
VKRSNGVIKASVHRSWVNKRCHCELAQSPKSLKDASVDDALLERLTVNEAVNRISKLQSTHSSLSIGEEKAKHNIFLDRQQNTYVCSFPKRERPRSFLNVAFIYRGLPVGTVLVSFD